MCSTLFSVLGFLPLLTFGNVRLLFPKSRTPFDFFDTRYNPNDRYCGVSQHLNLTPPPSPAGGPDVCSQTLEPGFVVNWSINEAQTHITFLLEVSQTDVWVAFGISPDGGMVGSDAVIVSDNGNIMEYNLLVTSADVNLAVEVDSDSEITDTSHSDDGSLITLGFTRPLATSSDLAIPLDNLSNVVWAYGTGQPLGYHGLYRGDSAYNPATIDFGTCLPGYTEAPTDVPTTAPTEVPTIPPTTEPTFTPTLAPTGVPGQPTEAPTEAPTDYPEEPTDAPEVCSETIANGVVVNWSINGAQTHITFLVEVSQTDVWVGFGISPDGGMVGADAVMVSDNGSIDEYNLLQKAGVANVAVETDTNELTDPSHSDDGSMITLGFTRPLSTPTDLEIDLTSPSLVVYAWGSGQSLGIHAGRGGSLGSEISIDFGACGEPTSEPTYVPTGVPTSIPTGVPTPSSTVLPTALPTTSPTSLPTGSPTVPPTGPPTVSPTVSPTVPPTYGPTEPPTPVGTAAPFPTPEITLDPTISPTVSPTIIPTGSPTGTPTDIPTKSPTGDPTVAPSSAPTGVPTSGPTGAPTTAMCSQTVAAGVVVKWSINQAQTHITFLLEVSQTMKWVGFGISPDGGMIGTDSVIVSGAQNAIEEYDLILKAGAANLALEADTTEITDTSFSDDGVLITLGYTRPLSTASDMEISLVNSTYVVYAYGSSRTLGIHAARGGIPVAPITIDFGGACGTLLLEKPDEVYILKPQQVLFQENDAANFEDFDIFDQSVTYLQSGATFFVTWRVSRPHCGPNCVLQDGSDYGTVLDIDSFTQGSSTDGAENLATTTLLHDDAISIFLVNYETDEVWHLNEGDSDTSGQLEVTLPQGIVCQECAIALKQTAHEFDTDELYYFKSCANVVIADTAATCPGDCYEGVCGGGICDCGDMYNGDYCETVSCEGQHSQLHGVCEAIGPDEFYFCEEGYSGTECSMDSYLLGDLNFDRDNYDSYFTATDFEAYWKIVGDEIQISLIAKTQGYIGFGWNPLTGDNLANGMRDTDMIIGMVNDDGSVFVGDFWSVERSTPIMDTQQPFDGSSSILDFSGKANGTHTMIVFRRSLHSDDPYDWSIEDQEMTVSYAIGQTNPDVSPSRPYPADNTDFYIPDALVYHGDGTHRGERELNFFDEETSDSATLYEGELKLSEDAALSWSISGDEITLTIRVSDVPDDRWVALGISDDGTMLGSEEAPDCWVVEPDGTTTEYDISSKESDASGFLVDEQQDVSGTYEQDEGVITATFTRLLYTDDITDAIICSEPVFIIFAYGESLGDTTLHYHGANRGDKEVDFELEDDAPCDQGHISGSSHCTSYFVWILVSMALCQLLA